MVAGGFAMVAVLLGVQWSQANAIGADGRLRSLARIALIAVLIPFLIVSLYGDRIAASEAIRLGATFLWLGGTVLIRLAMAAAVDGSSTGRSFATPSTGPIPNVLRQESQPNRLHQPGGDVTVPVLIRAQPRASRLTGVLAVLFLASVVVAPMAVEALGTHTPCEAVEVQLATGDREDLALDPIEWMPDVATPPYELTLDRAITLKTLVASRRNPDESRIELVKDGFVDGYERSYASPKDHIEYGAQRFRTADGALAFHAFANRYACQFANETFRGLRGSIGLQIRFASGKPIGEQVSWVSGTTRLLVFVDFDEPPPDHFRVEVLTRLVRVE
jgi:hypothetical protein